jgi:hypothetical protein
MHPFRCDVQQRHQDEGSQMCPGVRQNRVGRCALRLPVHTHRDDIKIECARGIPLAPYAPGASLDRLQPDQQFHRLWLGNSGGNAEMGHGVDVKRLSGGRNGFTFVPP